MVYLPLLLSWDRTFTAATVIIAAYCAIRRMLVKDASFSIMRPHPIYMISYKELLWQTFYIWNHDGMNQSKFVNDTFRKR